MLVDEFNLKKDKLKGIVDDNYSDVLGFLQRFYGINVCREVISGLESIRTEGNKVCMKALRELYNTDTYKRFFDSTLCGDVVLSTMVLFENYFPEFIDGSFDHRRLNDEEKKISSMLFTSSKAYNEASDEFKRTFNIIISIPRRKYIKKSKRVKINSELKDAIYDREFKFR